MHLTTSEIVYLLKTWNGWYLFQHDGDLNSEYSDNSVTVTISPINCKDIPEEALEDLREYTDQIVTCEPDEFRISFLFTAWEHQPGEIFEALKPVLAVAVDSKITIVNAMDFKETDLPEEETSASEPQTLPEPAPAAEITEEESGEPEEKEEEESESGETEKTDETGAPEEAGVVRKLHNEIVITGTICKDYIDVTEITHNGEPFPDLPIFQEASRLFETVERNFPEEEAPEGEPKPKRFTCSSSTEANLVMVYLQISSRTRPQVVDETTVETDAPVEDLATIITFVRYEKQFSLFKNPYYKRLQLKRKEHTKAMKAMMTQACSCMALGLFVIIAFAIGWMISRGGK